MSFKYWFEISKLSSMALRSFKGSEWTPIYMLVVMIIAVVLIFTLLKPILRQASTSAEENIKEARGFARGSVFLITKFFVFFEVPIPRGIFLGHVEADYSV